MSNDRPSVSIALPVFNGKNCLAETFEPLLTQTYSDFELIILDNASTDGTREIHQTCAVRDHRIRNYAFIKQVWKQPFHNSLIKSACYKNLVIE